MDGSQSLELGVSITGIHSNRLGFAVQLCLLRYPGYALGNDTALPEPVIQWVAKQVQADPA
ncbi:DUF4158 domain-containing protein, partial [Pseudomonas nitroreducens]|nr:DUF4158 domain-containing protein [Pseudomonas nitroreducens]